MDRFDEITATLNLVLLYLVSLTPKSLCGPEESKKTQEHSSTEQAQKGKSIDKTVKKVCYEESSSDDNYDSDSFEYESAPDTPSPKGAKGHMRFQVTVMRTWTRSQSQSLPSSA